MDLTNGAEAVCRIDLAFRQGALSFCQGEIKLADCEMRAR